MPANIKKKKQNVPPAKPDISVIIPVFNMADTLEAALLSLTGSAMNLEIIVVNDGSTDHVNEIAERFKTDIQADPAIRFVYKSVANGGRSAARNFGVKAATGKYISFLDADDSVGIQELAALWKCADSRNADLAIGQFLVVGEDGEPFARRRLDQNSSARELLRKIALSPLSPLHLNAILINRELLLAIPGFDTTNINAEDKDLTIRLLKFAKHCIICDTFHYIYKKHEIGRIPTIKKRLMWLYFRQRLLFQNYRGGLRLAGMFLQLHYDLAKLLYEAVLGYKKRIG